MTMTNHATTTSSVPNREYCQGIHDGFEKLLFFRFAKFDFVYLLKTAQQSRNKGSSGCATPKENINRISAIVDKEHFLVFCWQYSLFGTQVIDWSLKEKKHMLLLPSAVVAPSSSDLLAEPSISPARNLLTDLWWNIINDSSSRMRRSQADSSLLKPLLPSNTMFENHLKCLIWILAFWHFPSIFVLLKLTCLVTLFDRKLQF